MLKKLRNYFIAGLLVLLPLVTSVYILWILFNWVDGLLGRPLKLLPWEGPGTGILSAIIIIFLTGVLATNWFGKKLVKFTDRIFSRLPFIKNIYIAIKQITDTFGIETDTSFKRVVMVQYPKDGSYAIGFATGEAKGEPQQRTSKELLSIFIPTTPNPTSGMLILVPKEDIIFLDMTVEEGLKFVISGGVVAPEMRDQEES